MISMSASEIASLVGGRLHGDGRASVSGACTSQRPIFGRLCFANSAGDLTEDPTRHGAVLLAREEAVENLAGTWIAVKEPRSAFAIAMNAMVPAPAVGIHSTAVIDPSCTVGDDVAIGPHSVVGRDCVIGSASRIGANVVLGPSVTLGANVVIGSNTVVGEVGFGLVQTADDEMLRIPHSGGVRIDDEVEIGALVSIASGTIEPTRVRRGARIDDHVFIAHNCDIGENVCIIACAEISGSVAIGKDSWIGPNATVRDKVHIGKDILVGMGALVTKDLVEAGTYAGAPAKLIATRAAHHKGNDS